MSITSRSEIMAALWQLPTAVKGKWTQEWRQRQSTDKSSFIQQRAGSSTHTAGPWEFVAASVSSRQALATLTAIPISMAIYLPDNYWMTFENEVNVCSQERLSFLTTQVLLCLILIFLRQMENKRYPTVCFFTEWSRSNDNTLSNCVFLSNVPSKMRHSFNSALFTLYLLVTMVL